MWKLQDVFGFTAILIVIGLILQTNISNGAVPSSISLESLKTRFLPPELRNSNLTIDDLKKVLHEKCKKASGIDNSKHYLEIEAAAKNLTTCFSNYVNISSIQEEIEAARPTGELDSVFHTYCQKAPGLESCLKGFNSKIQNCLSKEEKRQNTVLMRVISSLMGFLCDRGGDQIALFVAEEGPECLEANKEAIAYCANNSFAEYIPKNGEMPDLFNLPEIVLSPEHCVDFERFEKCTLHHLEQCRDITPANVAESVFRFIKNETSCRKWINEKARERPILLDARDSAEILHINRIALLFIALIILVSKFS